MKPDAKRIPSLDGLRAIAISFVLVTHFMDGTPIQNRVAQSLIAPFRNGSLGVTVFFGISGFLITRLLMKEHEKTGRVSLKNFYIRRSFRILPAFLTFILFIVVLKLTGVLEITVANILSGLFFLMNYLHANQRWAMAHLWSLSVEEQFYMCWPIIFAVGGARRAMKVGIVLIFLLPVVRVAQYALFPAWRDHIGIMLHTRIDALMYGCVAAIAMDQPWFERLYRRLCSIHLHWILPLFVVFIAPYTVAHARGAYVLPIGFSLDSLASVLAMLWLIRNPLSIAGRIMNNAAVAWFGVLSYSIYLWHVPFFTKEPMGWPTTFWYNIPIVFILSISSYYLIEQPFLRLRARLKVG